MVVFLLFSFYNKKKLTKFLYHTTVCITNSFLWENLGVRPNTQPTNPLCMSGKRKYGYSVWLISNNDNFPWILSSISFSRNLNGFVFEISGHIEFYVGPFVVIWVITTRLVQWLSWALDTQERKKEVWREQIWKSCEYVSEQVFDEMCTNRFNQNQDQNQNQNQVLNSHLM